MTCFSAALVLLSDMALPSSALPDERKEALFKAASAKGEEATDNLMKFLFNGTTRTAALANTRTDENGESLLHLACIWGGARKIRGLLRAGADPNARSSAQKSSLDMTPLTWCCFAGYVDSVQEFLSDPRTNVNLVVRTEEGGFITALDIAHKIGGKGEPIVGCSRARRAHFRRLEVNVVWWGRNSRNATAVEGENVR